MRVELVAETPGVARWQCDTRFGDAARGHGWHGYWLNPGDAGDGPRAWRLRRAGEPRRSVPRARPPDPAQADELCLRTRLCAVGDAARAGGRGARQRSAGRARLDFWSAPTSCVPEIADVALELQVGPPGHQRAAAFDRYRRALPRRSAARDSSRSPAGACALNDPAAGEHRSTILFLRRQRRPSIHSSEQAVSRNGDLLIIRTGAGRRHRRPRRARRRARDQRRRRPVA